MKLLFYYLLGTFGLVLKGILLILLPLWLRELARLPLAHDRPFSRKVLWCSALFCLGFSFFCTHSFQLGLYGLLLVPLFLRSVLARQQNKRKLEIQSELISFLYSLRGLTEAGFSFPHALYHLSFGGSGKFKQVLQSFIHSFENGQAWEKMFTQVEKGEDDGMMRSLMLIDIAYQRGLSLMPILESVTSVVELEIQAKERLSLLKNNIFGQALISALVPWILLAVLFFFQPELVSPLLSSNTSWWVMTGLLGMEGCGLWVIQNTIRFY